MVSEDDSEVSNGERGARGENDPSRRDVLKGSGALASAGMMLTSPGLNHEANLTGEDCVPDEPKAGSQIRTFTVHALEVDLVHIMMNADLDVTVSSFLPGDMCALYISRRRPSCSD